MLWGNDDNHGWSSLGKWSDADRYNGNIGSLGWYMNPDDDAGFDEDGHYASGSSTRKRNDDDFGFESETGSYDSLFDTPDPLGFDDDEYFDDFDPPEDERFGNLEFSLSGSSGLSAARKLAGHLSGGDDFVLSPDKTCEDCTFWVPGGGHTTRGWCCAIWYWVQVRHGGSIEDCEPSDHRLCSRFKEGTGVAVTCYDCRFWDKGKLDVPRSEGCTCWSRFLLGEKLLRDEIWERFGSAVDFSVFQIDKPFIEGDVCFDFERDCDLEPGYGKRKAEEAKAHAESCQVTKRHTYVAGTAIEGRQSVWLLAMAQGKLDLSLERDPENEYDPNAVKVLVNGQMGGFIPAKIVQDAARVMDSGGRASVIEHEVSAKLKDGITKVDVQITLRLAGSAAPEDDDESAEADDGLIRIGRTLPEDRYYVNDDLVDAVMGPASTMMDKLKNKCK